MKSKIKKIMIAIILLSIVATLLFAGINTIANKSRIPDNPSEAVIDELVGIMVTSSQNLPQKPLIESEDSAREYARVLYQENYKYYEDWNNNYELWVKHYKKYGVWLVKWGKPDEQILDGPPWILFQDSDGKVLSYAN